MARPKGENTLRKHFKLTEETANLLAERSKAENMNESEYIRYLLLNQSKHPRSRELELEVMRLRNEINKIGAKFVLSNSDPKNVNFDDTFFDELYKEYEIKRISASRMINSKAANRGKINELLICN